ncbi:MAG: four helix bundle suffix domain-containing protein [Polyangiaceae bacterium]|nr:four helix bundle suffix domain-containing protein [Polyangiaceae bacterium]
MACVIQLGTDAFCRKFLTRRNDPAGRLYDQMTQAARSGKANIVEGSARSGTSKETEMKLTDVARASLSELSSDYEMWLLGKGVVPWHMDSEEAKKVLRIRFDEPHYGNDWVHDSCVHVLSQHNKFEKWLKSDDDIAAANCLLLLVRRCIYMLYKQISRQVREFEQGGGFREKLTQLRVDRKMRKSDAPSCPLCGCVMYLRKAATGRNPGTEFWGCSNYPACKGSVNIQ